jgi:hypothetical protein
LSHSTYDDTVFAWQLGTGLGCDLTKEITLDLGYRYLGTGDFSYETVEVDYEGPNENKILVQERVEKGYWGDICLPKHLSNESICLVTLLWEGCFLF